MPVEKRSDFQQEVVTAMIESKAIDFELVGSIISKFGERAALGGESLVQIIHPRVMWACGWPGPELDILRQVGREQGPS